MHYPKTFKPNSSFLKSALEELDQEIAADNAAAQKVAEKQNDGEGMGRDVTDPGEYSAATEGFLGAVGGAGASILIGIATTTIGLPLMPVFAAAGAGAAAAVAKKQKEVEVISKQIKELATVEGRKALASGKIDRDEYKKAVDIPWQDVVSGAVLGGLFGAVYGAIKGNQMQNKVEELEEKLKELDSILKDAEKNGMIKLKGKSANESTEEADAAAAAVASTAPGTAPEGDAVGQTQAGVGETPGTPSASEVPTTDVAGAAADGAPVDPAASAAAAPVDGVDAAAAPADNAGTQAADPAAADGNVAGADAASAAVDNQGAAAADQTDLDVGAAEIEAVQTDLDGAEQQGVAMEGMHRELMLISAGAAGLEALALTLESTKQVGGPNVHTAHMYQVGLETICEMLELKKPFTPAMEAIEETDAKINAADKAATGGKNLVQRMIEAMKAGLAKFGAWAANMWKFVTQASHRTLERAKKLQAGLASAQFSTAPVTGGVANAVQETSGFVKGFGYFSEVSKKFNAPATYSGYLEMMALVGQLDLNQGGSEGEIDGKVLAATTKMMGEFGSGMEKSSAEGVNVFKQQLIGQSILSITVPTTMATMGKFSTTVGLSQGVEAKKVEEVKAVTSAEAQTLLKLVIATLEEVAKTTNENGLKGVDDKLNQISATFKNKGTPPADPEGRVAKAIKSVTALLATRAKLPAYAINRSYTAAAATALNLISASVNAAKKEEAPAAAPAEGAAPAAAAPAAAAPAA